MAVLFLLLPTVSARAHNGLPFPIIIDQTVGTRVISVWTHPDIGTGLFFVIVSQSSGSIGSDDLQIQIGVQPISRRLAERFYPAEREDLRGQLQYKAVVEFDAQELWQVRVRLRDANGCAEAIATVEPTQPGFGRWDLLLYMAPFLAIGVVWLLAEMRRRTSTA